MLYGLPDYTFPPIPMEGPSLLKAGRHKNGKVKLKHSHDARVCQSCRVTLSHGRCLQRMCQMFQQEQPSR